MSNNYLELYKKYRPRVFDEVIGQDSAVKQIKSMIMADKVPTGIGFNAGPGSGKTTISLILTKALNCKNPVDKVTPCNQCEVCNAIDNNSQHGFKYFSAANSSSVEEMRKIVQEARLSYPINKPVFIVDECHRLSNTAWDAMLIPIESEKMNTLFLFCTTEPDKVPPAILSRITNITLPPVHWRTLTKHLYKIALAENLLDTKVTKEDLVACSQGARGSVRNAIQNLETVANEGKLPINSTSKVINAMLTGNPVEVIKVTREMNDEGADFVKTMEVIYREFTTALEISLGDTSVSTPASQEIAMKTNGSFIIKTLDILGDGINSMRNKLVSPQVLFEIPIIKITMIVKKIKSQQS